MSVSESSKVRCDIINILLLNISNDAIENGQDFTAVVTLCQQRKKNLLGHNEEESVRNCVWCLVYTHTTGVSVT